VKKLINNPDDVVREALQGTAAAHPDLKVFSDPYYIVRADAPVQGKVGIVSGGGSGHEPMHGGFVGMGMLDAACQGEVFTSPTPDQMLEATKAVSGGAGVLHIVKNYTGDVMNFEMAADLGKAEGIEVEAVVIDDDVAVQDSLYTAGRRGVGATVLAEKITGAAAEAKGSLADVAALCKKVNDQSRSMGMALTSCVTPSAGKPTFELGDDEMDEQHRRSDGEVDTGREHDERLTDGEGRHDRRLLQHDPDRRRPLEPAVAQDREHDARDRQHEGRADHRIAMERVLHLRQQRSPLLEQRPGVLAAAAHVGGDAPREIPRHRSPSFPGPAPAARGRRGTGTIMSVSACRPGRRSVSPSSAPCPPRRKGSRCRRPACR